MSEQTRWYQKWWGVLSLVLGVAVLIFGGIFFIITIRYWWQIKSGKAQTLGQQFYGNFSKSTLHNADTIKIKRSELETNDDPFLGNSSAKIVIVEFVDYLCPNSKSAATIMQKVVSQYGYKVKLIIRDFPAESLRSGATKLAELAYCAHQQGRFWKMNDVLFTKQDELSADINAVDIKSLASASGVDYNILMLCYNSGRAKIEVNQDYADAFRFGISGTPTFFINGEKVEGVAPWSAWEKYLENQK